MVLDSVLLHADPAIQSIFFTSLASKQNPGQISVYKVDSEAGRFIPDRRLPVRLRAAGTQSLMRRQPNGKNLYVINHDDNTVVEFAIGTDGKLYPQQTCNLPGSYPVQLTVNPASTYLYVVRRAGRTSVPAFPGPARW